MNYCYPSELEDNVSNKVIYLENLFRSNELSWQWKIELTCAMAAAKRAGGLARIAGSADLVVIVAFPQFGWWAGTRTFGASKLHKLAFQLLQVFLRQVAGIAEDVWNLVVDPSSKPDLLTKFGLQLLHSLLRKVNRLQLEVSDQGCFDFALLQDLGRDLQLVRFQFVAPLTLESFILDAIGQFWKIDGPLLLYYDLSWPSACTWVIYQLRLKLCGRKQINLFDEVRFSVMVMAKGHWSNS